MKKTNQLIFLLIVILISLGLALYYRQSESPVTEIPELVPVEAPQPVKQPIVHYPVNNSPALQEPPQPPEETGQAAQERELQLPETLPEIQNSDDSIKKSLASLFPDSTFAQILLTENFIQRLVATIDNLPEKKLPRNMLPLHPPKGSFIISGTEMAPQTSSRNNKRYTPYVTLFRQVSPQLGVKLYIHFYDLFQKAYAQLGYKNAYFNDRLIFVIDHLLETPNPEDPLPLAQPLILYTYANPAYENLSAGQKLLLRTGKENRSAVLTLLKEYRSILTGQHP